LFNQETGELAPDKEVLEVLKKNENVNQKLADSMNFIVNLRPSLKTRGNDALKLSLDFDEQSFFRENIDFITKSLDVDHIDIVTLTETEASTLPKPPTPGSPVIHFFDEAGEKMS